MPSISKGDIINTTAKEIVSTHILERIPFIFDDNIDKYTIWKSILSEFLSVDAKNICIIGSACCGCSLNPYNILREYNDESDVDVAIVSNYHFEISWRVLQNFKLSMARNQYERDWIADHKSRLVFYGAIATDKILRILPFAKEWTIAESKMKSINPTLGREISFRIYRDYDALRRYQISGIEKLKAGLIGG